MLSSVWSFTSERQGKGVNYTHFEHSIKPTIKESYLRNLLQGYEAAGLCGNRLLSQLGMSSFTPSGCGRVSVTQFIAVTEAIQTQLNDEMLGYMSKSVPAGSFDLIAKTMVKLPTIGDALVFYNDFLALFNNGRALLNCSYEKGETRIKLQLHSALQQRSPYFIQRMLLTTFKSMCWLSKTTVVLNKVCFTFPFETESKDFEYVFSCMDITSGDQNSLSLKGDIASLPIIQNDSEAEEFAKHFGLYTLLWPSSESLDIQIRNIIGPDISQGLPSFDSIAGSLNTSTQTLSRRLQEAGITYQSIKDNIRRDAAIALLNGGEKTIKEVAYAVGFKESGSFSKAFKQWVGVSPSEYCSASLNRI